MTSKLIFLCVPVSSFIKNQVRLRETWRTSDVSIDRLLVAEDKQSMIGTTFSDDVTISGMLHLVK